MKIFRNRTKLPEELLYRSFDTQLEHEENQLLDRALEKSISLRNLQETLKRIRRAIKQNRVKSFSPQFADHVMQQIYTISRATEDFFTALLWSFRRVTIPGLACLLMLIGHHLVNTGNISVETFLSRPQITLTETWPIDDLLEGDIE